MNYPTYPQQQQYVQPVQNQGYGNYKMMPYVQNITCPQVRPVSSIEEVRACPIEFDGSIFYFPDIANKKIYTKFVNMDGTVSINLYELSTLSNNTDHQIDTSTYVTRAEFEDVVNQLKQALKQEVPQSNAAQQSNYQF